MRSPEKGNVMEEDHRVNDGDADGLDRPDAARFDRVTLAILSMRSIDPATALADFTRIAGSDGAWETDAMPNDQTGAFLAPDLIPDGAGGLRAAGAYLAADGVTLHGSHELDDGTMGDPFIQMPGQSLPDTIRTACVGRRLDAVLDLSDRPGLTLLAAAVVTEVGEHDPWGSGTRCFFILEPDWRLVHRCQIGDENP